jgi:phage host-nuclease inhibitor protein Gam
MKAIVYFDDFGNFRIKEHNDDPVFVEVEEQDYEEMLNFIEKFGELQVRLNALYDELEDKHQNYISQEYLKKINKQDKDEIQF